jgi:hypothetical protein
MDVHSMLEELHEELQRLDEAIAVLQRIASGQSPRRGRPPKWMTAESGGAPKLKRVMSPEARKKIAEAAKKRWAAVRESKP